MRRSPFLPRRLSGFAVLLALACMMHGVAPAADSPAEARVARVVDGDTLLLADGQIVRLASIMAPKRSAAAARASDVHAHAALRALGEMVEGEVVRVAVSGSGIDRYRRLVAYLFDRQDRFVQAELVRRGLVRVDPLPGGRERVRALLLLEGEARTAGRGLWASHNFAVRGPEEARRHVDRFELVEGRVLEAKPVGGRTYLNFGADWRDDFTVAVPRENSQAFTAAGLDLRALRGKMIRVRGWIQWRDGPLIEAIHPEQIEVLER